MAYGNHYSNSFGMNEAARRAFCPTPEEREEDRRKFLRQEEERKRIEAIRQEMGHGEARWSRLVRRYGSKHPEAKR